MNGLLQHRHVLVEINGPSQAAIGPVGRFRAHRQYEQGVSQSSHAKRAEESRRRGCIGRRASLSYGRRHPVACSVTTQACSRRRNPWVLKRNILTFGCRWNFAHRRRTSSNSHGCEAGSVLERICLPALQTTHESTRDTAIIKNANKRAIDIGTPKISLVRGFSPENDTTQIEQV